MTRVLIVDDEGLVSEHLRGAVERLGYEAPEVVPSGEEALRLAARFPPDLVLLDVSLRGPLDGVDTAARLRALVDVPVVFLSSIDDDATLVRALATRPQGYLLKPIDERQLRAALELALVNHQTERALRVRERHFDAALRSIDDGVVATDAEGRVVMMNRAAEQLTGWRADDAVGRDAWLVLRLVDVPVAVGVAARHHHQGMLVVSRNGEERLVDEIATPVFDERGRPLGALLVLCDLGGKAALTSPAPRAATPFRPAPALAFGAPASLASADVAPVSLAPVSLAPALLAPAAFASAALASTTLASAALTSAALTSAALASAALASAALAPADLGAAPGQPLVTPTLMSPVWSDSFLSGVAGSKAGRR